MQEMDAKRSTKLPQRESTEENDRADTLSDACQVGDTDGDVPVTQSTQTKSAEAPEATQEAPLVFIFQFSAFTVHNDSNSGYSLRPRRLRDADFGRDFDLEDRLERLDRLPSRSPGLPSAVSAAPSPPATL